MQEIKYNTEQELYHAWYKAHAEQRNLQVLSALKINRLTDITSKGQQLNYKQSEHTVSSSLKQIYAQDQKLRRDAYSRHHISRTRSCTGQSNQHCPLTRIKKENDDTDVCTCMVKEKLCKPCFYCSDHMPNIEFSPAANIKKDNSIVPKMPIK